MHIRSKPRLLLLMASVLFAVLGTLFMLHQGSALVQFSRAYRQLQLGMAQDDVRKLFGPAPDFDCRYKSYHIWYYRAPDLFFTPTIKYTYDNLQRGAMVQSLNNLPNVYDNVQLAFDTNGRLYAYTWIGESYTVECMNGQVNGSDFSKLTGKWQ